MIPSRHPVRRSWPGAALVLLLLAACQGPQPRDASEPPPVDNDDFPIAYSLGTFDRRFGIGEGDFLRVVGEAKAVWEKPAGRPLFRFEPGAEFTVNLVFDERQERTIEARKVKAAIDSRGRSYDALVWQHTRRSERLAESQGRYEAAAGELQKRVDEHNARVAYWNEKGGASAGEFERLNAEQRGLAAEQASLERLASEVSDDVAAVNELVLQINDLASVNNIEVTYFNGKFVESREFEQGVFTGRDITIYQYTEVADLRVALVHEFGHALGFGHVPDPAAVMHYKMGGQDFTKSLLAAADLELLRKKFSEE